MAVLSSGILMNGGRVDVIRSSVDLEQEQDDLTPVYVGPESGLNYNGVAGEGEMRETRNPDTRLY
jgi:hypothetical protein